MKGLKTWQKMGLVAAIVSGLTLGGLTPKYSSKGLESKLPTIGVSVAEAKETNPQGYQIPDLTGLQPYQKGYLKEEPTVLVERFNMPNGTYVGRLSVNGKVFAYDIDPTKTPDTVSKYSYAIVDTNGDGTFETKYSVGENFDVPSWVKS